ncbi:YtxH domain-containing protein [Marinoscillum pacificum]|uniref:YtxH domain-containing protein n=1 Tax=Marinoscillum pacificum TaxID=392723 RepID=UPI002157B940|nr:YtxH domain-containing protein [Marinoscillum pacificum]
MSAGKTLLTLVAGIASGLAIAYYADPKGSKQKLKKIEKDIKKTRKNLDKKLDSYKGTYNEVVDKYASKSKALIDEAKGIVDNAKAKAKA